MRPTHKPATSPRTLRLLPIALVGLVALSPLACAGTQEPPAPPPPPVDPAAFSGPARSPAPEVDLDANLNAANVWEDAGGQAKENAPAATASASVAMSATPDAGADAQVPSKPKRASK